MKAKFLIFTFIFLLIWGAVYLYQNRSYEVVNVGVNEGPIVAFGDSLVEGVGSPQTEGFVGILEDRIGEDIINLGVSGDTTEEGLARIDEVLEEDPRLVIVLLGGNDAIQRIPLDTTFANLAVIIDRIQEKGSAVLLVGVQSGVFGDQYKDRFRDLARTKGAAHVPDILDGLIGRTELMADTIHPNQVGYTKVADRITPVLRALIE